MIKPFKTQLLLAAAILATPGVAFAAQEEVTDQANRVAAQARELQQETNQLTNAVAAQNGEENDRDRATRDDGNDNNVRDRDDGDDDDDSGKWGWLGLLGLAGLLGLRRRDDHHHHDRGVHVDADRDRTTRL